MKKALLAFALMLANTEHSTARVFVSGDASQRILAEKIDFPVLSGAALGAEECGFRPTPWTMCVLFPSEKSGVMDEAYRWLLVERGWVDAGEVAGFAFFSHSAGEKGCSYVLAMSGGTTLDRNIGWIAIGIEPLAICYTDSRQ